MQILFDKEKTNILFIHENGDEYKWLTKFPAFVKNGMYYSLPAILPVAYNVIERIRRQKKILKFDPDILAWIEQDFRLKILPEDFKYHTTPKDFQDISLRFLYTLESAGLLLDPGMGKSKVVLDYIFLKKFKKVIIICPRSLLFVWEDEILKHRPELNYHTVLTTDWESEKPKVMASQVTIVNYDKVSLLKHQLKQIDYEFIHVDEFLIKDPGTNRTQSITELSKGIPFRCGGSGTLINNSALDAFSPIRYLHPSLVGWNYTNFLTKYTIQKQLKNSTQKIVVAVRGQDEIRSMLESCCIVMTKDKWLKLPNKVFKDVYVTMSDEQRDAYYGLMRNYFVNIGGRDIYVDNPLVMLSKLYQIANGFIYIDKEEQNEVVNELLLGETYGSKNRKSQKKDVFLFKTRPKINALKRILVETLEGKKAIIWFNMGGELTQILALMQETGNSHLVIKGGEKDIGGKVRAFNKDASIRWLICQAQSVNYGITVLGSKKADLEKEGLEVFPDLDSSVCNEVFFSISFSLERYKQQQDRIHRLGQEHECTYYRIFSNAPVERRIREVIEDKMSISDEMLVDIAEKLRGEKIET